MDLADPRRERPRIDAANADDAARLKPGVEMLQRTITRLQGYLHMADFGTCAVSWPLQEQWEKDILAGKMPEL